MRLLRPWLAGSFAVAATALIGVSAAAGLQGRDRGAADSVVSVNLSAVRQTIQGFGSSTRVWSDPHLSKSPITVVPQAARQQILSALYGRLGLTISRQSLDQGIEASRGGPFNFSAKLGADQIAYVKQARSFGLKTVFPVPVYFEDWTSADDPGAYVSYAMGVLRYWRSQGYEPPLYSPINEPQISHDFSPQWLHDVVVMLGRQMRQAGLKTKLVIPDDENPIDAYRRAVAVLSDPEARKYVGVVAFHIYKGSESDWPKLHTLASKYGLPLWMTEYWQPDWDQWPNVLNWGTTINDLFSVAGVGAVNYIWAFFGDWAGGAAGAYISIQFDNGQYRGFTPTPLYYVTGQYSRFVRPGYVRVATTGSTHDILTTAFRSPKHAVVVAINKGSSNNVVKFAFRGGQLLRRVSVTRTSETEKWRALPPAAVVRGSLTASLPPQSITTFVLDRRP